MTISIPDQLKAKMDSIKETVNWSAVAAQAFEHKLLELKLNKEIRNNMADNIENVVARLRMSKKNTVDKEINDGRRAGEKWASADASFEELQRVAACQPVKNHFGLGFSMSEQVALAAAGHKNDIVGAMSFSKTDALVFWNKIGSELAPSDRFTESFLEGARHIWKQVKDKL